jgi:hypothetical protein
MLEALALLLFLSIGIVAMLVDIAKWPCGRCHRRVLPWVKSCPACLRELAGRFDLPKLKVQDGIKQSIERFKDG